MQRLFGLILLFSATLCATPSPHQSISVDLGGIHELALSIVTSCLDLENDSPISKYVADHVQEILATDTKIKKDTEANDEWEQESVRPARTLSEIDRKELVEIVLRATRAALIEQHIQNTSLQNEVENRYTKKFVAISGALAAIVPSVLAVMVTLLIFYSSNQCSQ